MTRAALTRLLMPALAALTLWGCERRPLYYDDANLHVLIDVDYDITNGVDIHTPEMMKVAFHDPASHAQERVVYVGPDGGYATVDPVTYDVVAYNFDTEATQIRNEKDITTAEAFTEHVPSDVLAHYNRMMKTIQAHRASLEVSTPLSRDYDEETLVNQPDHLFVGTVNNVAIPPRHDETDIFTLTVHASSIVQAWRLEIGPVTGQQYISSAVAYVSGQVNSELLCSRIATGFPVILSVPFVSTQSRAALMETVFNTFGHHSEAHAYVVLNIIDTMGNEKIYEWDVTDQFDDPANTEQVIRVDCPITVNPPEDGGLRPSVTLWEDCEYPITL